MKSSPARHPRSLFLAVAMLLPVLNLGCKGRIVDDPALNASIEAKLHQDGALAGEGIHSSVQDAVATLTGTVSSAAARSLAANDAAQVVGLRTVINNLTVQAAPIPGEQQSQMLPPPQENTTPPPQIKRDLKKSRSLASAQRRVERAAPIERAPTNITPQVPPTPAIVSQQPHPLSVPSAPTFRDITLPAGTTIPVRIGRGLDSATNQQGDAISGTVATDVLADGIVAIPQGSKVSGRVDTVQEASHYKGNSLLVLELTGLDRRGEHISVTTEPFTKQGAGRGKNTAEKVGGGAAVGAILGGIFGGGRGAAIGAAAGGGVGAGANTITRGQQVQIPSETLITFKLSSPLALHVRTSPSTHSQGLPLDGPSGQPDPSLQGSPSNNGRRPLPPLDPQ